jgi:hypothetical protein
MECGPERASATSIWYWPIVRITPLRADRVADAVQQLDDDHGDHHSRPGDGVDDDPGQRES